MAPPPRRIHSGPCGASASRSADGETGPGSDGRGGAGSCASGGAAAATETELVRIELRSLTDHGPPFHVAHL